MGPGDTPAPGKMSELLLSSILHSGIQVQGSSGLHDKRALTRECLSWHVCSAPGAVSCIFRWRMIGAEQSIPFLSGSHLPPHVGQICGQVVPRRMGDPRLPLSIIRFLPPLSPSGPLPSLKLVYQVKNGSKNSLIGRRFRLKLWP